jgi:hypothetical protein
MAATKKSLQSTDRLGFTVLELGDMEIWDGADLSLLRESLSRLIVGKKCRRVGVDMTFVKYIPSGFFGMLSDWNDAGIRIRLYSPQPNVARMLWFNRFFEPQAEGAYELIPSRHELPTEEYPLIPEQSTPASTWERTANLRGDVSVVSPQ